MKRQRVAMLTCPNIEDIEEWMQEAWIDEGWTVKSVQVSSAFDPGAGDRGLLIHTICAIVETDELENDRQDS